MPNIWDKWGRDIRYRHHFKDYTSSYLFAIRKAEEIRFALGALAPDHVRLAGALPAHLGAHRRLPRLRPLVVALAREGAAVEIGGHAQHGLLAIPCGFHIDVESF